MKLQLTDDAPATVSYGYVDGGLSPGDEFDVDGAKGEALLDAHDYLERVVDIAEEEYEVTSGDGLADATYDELYERATEAGIEGRSTMTKDELIGELRED